MEEKEYDVVLQGLIKKREGLLAELAKVNTAIGAIEELSGSPPSMPTSAGNSAILESTPVSLSKESPPKELGAIRPDEYFGLSQGQAAKKYLQRVGHAVSIDEIIKGITQGGIKLAGDTRKNLYITLVRNTAEFVLVGPNTFGLREFYPHLRRGKKENKLITPKKRRGRPPKSTKTPTQARTDKEKEGKRTTRKAQSEGQAQTAPKGGEVG